MSLITAVQRRILDLTSSPFSEREARPPCLVVLIFQIFRFCPRSRSRLLHPRFFNLLTLARASLLLVVRIFNVLVHDLVKKNDILISWRLNQTSILFPRSGQVLSKYQTPYYHHHENPCGHIRPILCANHEGALAYSKYIPKVADPPL